MVYRLSDYLVKTFFKGEPGLRILFGVNCSSKASVKICVFSVAITTFLFRCSFIRRYRGLSRVCEGSCYLFNTSMLQIDWYSILISVSMKSFHLLV